MSNITSNDRIALAEAFAFLGNSLLAPMTRTEKVGLYPEFWESLPAFGDARVAGATARCAQYASTIVGGVDDDDALAVILEEASHKVAQEYTALFIGPAHIKAIPWQTYYDNPDAMSGFGRATFDMLAKLREIGLSISSENNQYADHMGIELLLLSEYLKRECQVDDAKICAYIRSYPGSWIGSFLQNISASVPDGYFAGIVGVAHALIAFTLEELA